ncbi:integration host factor subunit beta [Gammaproteobacteria bacterium]
MTKSELIDIIAKGQMALPTQDVELAVKAILDQMAETLSSGERIEIRGFGSFSLHYRPPHQARNPKTGEPVETTGKHVPHFKPGRELRERVNETFVGVDGQAALD